MSTNCPAVSKRPSMSRRLRPLSMTWVRPSARGFPGRGGRSRKPSLESGIELLQLLLGAFLDVVEHGISVAVDSDGERTKVLDAKLPEALGHELLPGDLLDLLDLGRLERGRSTDDREVDHSEALGEADHAGARRRADADLLVSSGSELSYARCGVKQEGAR